MLVLLKLKLLLMIVVVHLPPLSNILSISSLLCEGYSCSQCVCIFTMVPQFSYDSYHTSMNFHIISETDFLKKHVIFFHFKSPDFKSVGKHTVCYARVVFNQGNGNCF